MKYEFFAKDAVQLKVEFPIVNISHALCICCQEQQHRVEKLRNFQYFIPGTCVTHTKFIPIACHNILSVGRMNFSPIKFVVFH